jgi:DNA-binding HxlR family transcriptional regulator
LSEDGTLSVPCHPMDTGLDLREHGGVDAFWQACPAREVLDLLADKWSLLTVAAIGSGVRRHGELRRQLEGISPKMLSQTLKRLDRHGLVKRTQYPTIPPQVTYELTSLGASLSGPVSAIKSWAETHVGRIEAAKQEYDQGQRGR